MHDDEGLVRAAIADIAAVMNDDRDTLARGMFDRLAPELRQLRGDESLLNLLVGSIESNIGCALQILRYDLDITEVEVPPAAVAYARRLAQHGVTVRALVRAYRLGQDSFLKHAFALLNARVADPWAIARAAELLTAVAFDYVDRMSEQVFETYEEERERWLRQRDAVREACVRRLLDEQPVDVHASERTLGYRLVGVRHLAVVAWVASSSSTTNGPAQVVRLLADRLNCPAEPLFVPRDETTAWAWLPLGSTSPTPGELRAAVARTAGEAMVAFGDHGTDVDGFRRSHEQALQTRAVMLAAGDEAATVATFSEVGPVALLCGDLRLAKVWVAETLRALAVDDDVHARLRETLRVFLATGGSYVSAADQLALHRNSVHYRVRKAEEELGRPIESDRLNMEIALTVCRWLGRAVLTQPT
ncbi:PucR family transcriptional regulator [Kutzneria sp. CA-103260]|uniref:PucR family transcriptional regulator n=1 Tax=Kutzneria sp. CA-103260 TaxID=2802641 RepID=UPI001BAD5FD6|nr:helix-turn-helix domain-containing protein [Kutzneria sp. CA-103260]QUQ64459.1 hypothetical protein JJ691_21790 [Kutzneria sp. CA-103260]